MLPSNQLSAPPSQGRSNLRNQYQFLETGVEKSEIGVSIERATVYLVASQSRVLLPIVQRLEQSGAACSDSNCLPIRYPRLLYRLKRRRQMHFRIFVAAQYQKQMLAGFNCEPCLLHVLTKHSNCSCQLPHQIVSSLGPEAGHADTAERGDRRIEYTKLFAVVLLVPGVNNIIQA